MNINVIKTDEIMERLALQEAANLSLQSAAHGHRISRLPVDSWQANVIGRSPNVTIAKTPAELRAALMDGSTHLIFLPQSAIVTAEVIDRLCAESTLNKMVIWETNA